VLVDAGQQQGPGQSGDSVDVDVRQGDLDQVPVVLRGQVDLGLG
jgi:hypothetical protein